MKSIALIVAAIVALACLAMSAQAQLTDASSCTKIDSKLDLNGCITCCRKFGKSTSSMVMFSSSCACSEEAVRTRQLKSM